ncbi:MAG: hypothetical protein IPM47_17980 [Sphingobacteriales bacterium]|nr:MAG: hypothetical protein IPM47_17980 [Sphingobacteriales bacterium]
MGFLLNINIRQPYFYAVIMTDEISEKINTNAIDNFLSLTIDPLGRAIPKSKLVKDYNYPKEDVYDLDFEDW